MIFVRNILLFTFIVISSTLMAENTYQVGYKKLEVTSKNTNETFPVALVYPTRTLSKAVRFGPFELDLAIGAPFAPLTGSVERKYPLVIISHGSGGTNLGHRSIAFALVKKGFVVAMPLHPENNYKDNSAEGSFKNWLNRPKHIIATIDALASTSSKQSISEYIDINKVAVIGHSAGGYTALAVAGGNADTVHLYDLCSKYTKQNQEFCGLSSELEMPAEFASKKILNKRDDRVKAIVLLAPVGVMFKSKEALQDVDAPLMLLRAEKDTQLIEPHHADVIANNYLHKSKLTYRTIKNAGHYSFITPFPKSIRSRLGEVAEDPDGFDREVFHQTLSEEITEYLETNLK